MIPTRQDLLDRAARVADGLGVFFVESRVPVIVVSPDGRFVTANRAAIDQYGYSLEELLGLRIHDIVDPTYGEVDADLRIVQARHTALGRRPHRRKDGTKFWVVPTAGPLVVDEESLVVSVLTDVTAVLDAETRVSELEAAARRDRERAEALWLAATEHLTDGVALIDDDLRVVRCNSGLSAMLLRPTHDIVGRRCAELFVTCAQPETCMHRAVLASDGRVVREIIGRASHRPLRVEVIPASASRPHFALVHTAHDLSEERAIRTRLVTADRLASIGRLAAGVAHEINNPAAFVTVNLGVLRDWFAAGAPAGIDVLPMLDESLVGMERIRDIVRDLKGFARERSRDRVDLTVLVGSAIRMAAHETAARARLERHLEAGLFVHVRTARIAQVILNLLVNAAQAIPPGNPKGNRIVVRAFRDRDRAKVEVSDTGTGIPAEHASRIYEAFFTTREGAGGTGLGLWLARAILEEEGGSISSSNLPSGGARFEFDLPLSDTGGLAEGSPVASPDSPPG
jgi:PAS domain S-box-containing protein